MQINTDHAPVLRLTAGQYNDIIEAHAAGERPSVRATLEQHAEFSEADRLDALGPAIHAAVASTLHRIEIGVPAATPEAQQAPESDPLSIEWCYLDERDAPDVQVEHDDTHPDAFVVTVDRFGLASMERVAVIGRWAHFSNGTDHMIVHRSHGPLGRHDTLVALGARTADAHGADFGLDRIVVEGTGRSLTTRVALRDVQCPVVFTEPTDDATAARLAREALEEYRRTRIRAVTFSLHAADDDKAITVHTGCIGGDRGELLRHLEAIVEHVERCGVEHAQAGEPKHPPMSAIAGGAFETDIPF